MKHQRITRENCRRLRTASTEALESRVLLSVMPLAKPDQGAERLPPPDALNLGPTRLLPGDAAPALAAGIQERPELSRGGNQFLAVWEDRRTALSFTGTNGPYFGDGHGTMTDILAARMDADGNVIDTTAIHISTAEYNQIQPHVGWNGQNWLVTWANQRDQYYWDTLAVRVSPAGEVLDSTPIVLQAAQTSIDFYPPFTVSSDGSNWAVLWKDINVAEGRWTMVGSIVQPDGTLVNPGGKLLREPPGNIFIGNADMVFAQDEYFAVWSEYGSNAVDPIVLAQRFSASLDPLGAVFTVDDFSPTRAFKPSVATDGTDYFVTWSEEKNFLYNQVFGARVSHAGVVQDPAGIQITPQFQDRAAYAPDVTFDGTNYVVAYSADGMSFFGDIKARQIAPSGALVGSEITISASGHQDDQPSIAPRPGGGTQVVFRDGATEFNDGDILGATLASNGTVGPIVGVSESVPRQSRPQFAFNGSGNMSVFQSDISGTHRIAAQRLDASGTAIDAEPVIVASGSGVANPDVAFNGSEYLVTWEDANQIYAKRLRLDGTIIDAASISVMPGNTPAVAALNGSFLVVDSRENPHEIRQIFAVRVGADGSVLGSPVLLGGNFSITPRLTTVGNRWLVAFETHASHDASNATVSARFVEADGTPGSAMSISNGQGFFPDLASNGDSALVTFSAFGSSSHDIFGRRVNADGSSGATFVISNAANTQERPAAGWDGTKFLVEWIDFRNYTYPQQDRTDIYGTRVQLDNTVVDADGIPLAVGDATEETPAIADGAGGSALFSWASYRAEAPYGAFRIVTRQLVPAEFAHLAGHALIVDGTSDADTFTLAINGANIVVTRGSSSLSFPSSSVSSIIVDGLAGDDVLNINSTLGVPVTFKGGGASDSDAVNVNAGASFTFDADAGSTTTNLTVNVAGGATVGFNATQHLAALNVASDGTARLTFGGTKVLVTRSLSITGSGDLDLNDNDLIVEYTGPSQLPAVQTMINRARNGGFWNGSGLTSSFARASSPHITGLGAIEATDYQSVYGGSATFDGESIDATAVLVKYTYYGDSDFNGVVNFDDYSRTDSGFNRGRSGWLNGDFDGNGTVNFDDYSLIDLAFNWQGAAL